MTNYEKFKNEIAALNYSFAVTKTQEICLCETTECADCIFSDRGCSCDVCKIQWLYEEAQKVFSITTQEKDFLSFFREDSYIARDYTGQLFIYSKKPIQMFNCWVLEDEELESEFRIRSDFFEFITWESDKCWSVAELLRMPVKE